MDPVLYAIERARSAPDHTKYYAILCLRDLVENHGTPLKQAITAVQASWRLGMADLSDLRLEAYMYYAPAVSNE